MCLNKRKENTIGFQPKIVFSKIPPLEAVEYVIKTIAIEADNLAEAEKRANNAYCYEEIELDYSIADDVQFINVNEEDIFTEENVELFNCHNVVYDTEYDVYVCPVCGKYVCSGYNIKDIDHPVPSYCNDCGTKLWY